MKNNTKKSINIGKINIPLNYWTGLAVYAVILLILAICMIAYTGSCLKKYENSQSDKVMNDFINDFTKMAAVIIQKSLCMTYMLMTRRLPE